MPTQIRTEIGEAIAASAAVFLYYHDASNSAELEPTFRQGADTWATHLVTSAAGRAATFGMILTAQGADIQSKLARPLLWPLCILRNLQQTCS